MAIIMTVNAIWPYGADVNTYQPFSAKGRPMYRFVTYGKRSTGPIDPFGIFKLNSKRIGNVLKILTSPFQSDTRKKQRHFN